MGYQRLVTDHWSCDGKNCEERFTYSHSVGIGFMPKEVELAPTRDGWAFVNSVYGARIFCPKCFSKFSVFAA